MFKKCKILISTIIVGMFLSLVSCGNKSRATDFEGDINIYALNDFHGAFERSTSYAGLSSIGNYLYQEKTNNPDSTFILSSGDMWQGTVDSNINHGAMVTEAMNAIGFDSMTIGNHEFDWNEEYIKSNEFLMKYPLLACNIFYAGTSNWPEYLKPYTVIDRGNYRIGVIGAVKEEMGRSILRSISDKFDFPNPVSYIKEYSDILFSEEDCDAVIVSAHDGDHTVYSSLNSISPISHRRYIDGLFLAHDHQVQNDYIGEIPYVEGGSNGSRLSKITMHITRKNGKSSVSDAWGQTINTINSCFGKLESVDAVYNKYLPEIEKVKNEVVGFVPEGLSRNKVAKAASEAILHYVNENQDIYGHKIQYACINNGGTRDILKAGKITYGNIIKVLPFDNVVEVVKLTKTQLDSYLSDSSSVTAFKSGEIIPDSDGYYYIGSINYLTEIMEEKGLNTERIVGTEVIRDILKEQIMKGNVSTIVPYTGQKDPETEVWNEPEIVETTVDDFIASNDEDMTYKYHLTGIVDSWEGSNTDGTQYGDFYLRSLTSDKKLYIYGATATSGKIGFSMGEYYFNNPKDWLTNSLTSSIKLGDTIEMYLVRKVYNGIIEGLGEVIRIVK